MSFSWRPQAVLGGYTDHANPQDAWGWLCKSRKRLGEVRWGMFIQPFPPSLSEYAEDSISAGVSRVRQQDCRESCSLDVLAGKLNHGYSKFIYGDSVGRHLFDDYCHYLKMDFERRPFPGQEEPVIYWEGAVCTEPNLNFKVTHLHNYGKHSCSACLREIRVLRVLTIFALQVSQTRQNRMRNLWRS